MGVTRLKLLTQAVWSLTKSYWQSEERWSASAFLALIIGLNLGLVYVTVLQNQANGSLFTALQRHDGSGFFRAFGVVVLLIMLYFTVAAFRVFLDQTFQLRWRRWLTDQYIERWLADRTFYRMRFSERVDNPDQRISEDVRLFIERTMDLGLGLLNSLATLVSFAALLWILSGSITLPLGSFEITIPGYMFWAAVLYSAFGSVIAHWIGRPLIGLYNRRQAVEADFRFNLLRLREEAEAIALYGGEAQERFNAMGRFQKIYETIKRIILRSNQFLIFQLFFSQFVNLFALLIASPGYFSGAIELGALMQIANAFQRVNEALSWFVGSYTNFAEWRATVDRLIEFDSEMQNEVEAGASSRHIEIAPQDTIELQNVGVVRPDGTALLAPVTLRFMPGEAVMVTGSSGTGKTTLFRILAGLWPFTTGRVRLPERAKTLFLPQRPYMPIATLRGALWFPARPPSDREGEVRAALELVGLSWLDTRLDEHAHWMQILSPGEQQRAAIVRALLIKPDWLFLDEATSALDEDQEAELYRNLAAALPGTTIVSIAHRHSLVAYHSRILTVDRAMGLPGRLVELSVGVVDAEDSPPRVARSGT